MSGIWSGQGFAQKRQKVVEDCASVSITELQQHGVFTTGQKTEWNPEATGGRLLQVVAHALGNRLILVVAYRVGSRQVQVATATVTISWSACHYGGKRPWFVCPGPVAPEGVVARDVADDVEGEVDRKVCGRRVTKLYLTEQGQLRCRACAGLAYRSDHLKSPERPLQEARKILRQMGGSGSVVEGFPERPKGMHFDTWHSAGWRVHNLLAEYGRRSREGLEELLEPQGTSASDAPASDAPDPDASHPPDEGANSLGERQSE